ncbi:nucleotide sugar dehydrogenase [Methylocystis heyeri]|uniref:nucleotide sugar dehydrogenase n=1 Tax=Methylocystis heyeri TaxID=391905 RepID=UPI00113CAED4|nr:nucleotide sugar dehydrogenase [Methylocystis heyeri]
MIAINQLLEDFKTKKISVGIVGLGYVGLPLALSAAMGGYRTLGFDIDPDKIEAIHAGQSYLKHISAGSIAEAMHTGLLNATMDFSRLDEVDAVIICVPTPLTQNRDPDLTHVVRTTEVIAKKLRKGQLVALESTTWPGTTAEVVKPILDATGLVYGTDYFLAFSPEREDPGNAHFTTRTIPKVVGADDEASLQLAVALYENIVSSVTSVSSTRAAEAAKLTENIFRAVNIALVNELKIVYDAMGIDVWEVIEAAKTKPFGYMPFYPGPGLGGHCIPIDPFYLTWKAREFEVSTKFIELAGEVNTTMPRYVVEKVARHVDANLKIGLSATNVLVVGIAYKKNIDDMRESPALRIIEILEDRGAKVSFYDPHVPVIPATREHANLTGRKSIHWEDLAAEKFTVALVVTDHDVIDYDALRSAASIVVDTRNIYTRRSITGDNIFKA